MNWSQKTIEKNTYLSFQNQIQALVGSGSKKKVAIWGAGVRGILAGMILEDFGIEEFIFIDSDISRQGKMLGGHQIESFDSIECNSTYTILSMEYHESVKTNLLNRGLIEGKDFGCLRSGSYDEIIGELKRNIDNEILILGTSSVHVLPLEERTQEDLSEILTRRCGKNIKVLGSTCLGTRMMYYLIKSEMSRNPNLSQIVILTNWETLTSFHDDLPRTQKPQLWEALIKYANGLGMDTFVRGLVKEWELAKNKAQNYELENKYSPSRLDTKQEGYEALKEYLELSTLEDLDSDCNEILFLIRILKEMNENEIRVSFIVEPVNMKLGVELCGERFAEVIKEKYNFLNEIAHKYGAECYDATELLGTKEFVAINTVSEAQYLQGRNKFADYILQTIEKAGKENE